MQKKIDKGTPITQIYDDKRAFLPKLLWCILLLYNFFSQTYDFELKALMVPMYGRDERNNRKYNFYRKKREKNKSNALRQQCVFQVEKGIFYDLKKIIKIIMNKKF